MPACILVCSILVHIWYRLLTAAVRNEREISHILPFDAHAHNPRYTLTCLQFRMYTYNRRNIYHTLTRKHFFTRRRPSTMLALYILTNTYSTTLLIHCRDLLLLLALLQHLLNAATFCAASSCQAGPKIIRKLQLSHAHRECALWASRALHKTSLYICTYISNEYCMHAHALQGEYVMNTRTAGHIESVPSAKISLILK